MNKFLQLPLTTEVPGSASVSHSVGPDFVTPWTRVTCQVPPSLGFSGQEYWSQLPLPSPGDLPNPGTEPGSPALQVDSLLSEPPEKSMVPAIPKLREAINGPDVRTRSAPSAQKLPLSAAEFAGTSKPQGHAGPC